MPTSSFSKDFTLDSKKAAESLAKMIAAPAKSQSIDRSLTSPEKVRRGELKLKQILAHHRETSQ